MFELAKRSHFGSFQKIMCHNYDTSKGRSFGEGKSLYESSFEEGEISSPILHPGKVATEGRQFGYPDAMVHIL